MTFLYNLVNALVDKKMTTGYQIINQGAIHYMTFQIVFWIDVFSRECYREIVIDSLKYCQKEKGLEIFAFVIMSNHIHILARSKTNQLSDTIRDFKKYTSKKIVEEIKNTNESRKEWMLNLFSYAAKRQNKQGKYQLWTHENHAIEVYSDKFISDRIDYIHNNPVKNGLVENPEDYIYSSAKHYSGDNCVLKITTASMNWKSI